MQDPIARTPARVERGLGRDRLQKSLDRLAANGQRLFPPSIWGAVVKALRARDGDSCCFGPWCVFGRPLKFDGWQPYLEAITIEHRRPWSKYREHRLEDMALAHRLCNELDGNLRHRYQTRELRLAERYGCPYGTRSYMTAWPALTYADELEFDK